jgi:hypothetical protein
MQHLPDRSRRQLLAWPVGAVALAVSGCGAAATTDRQLRFVSLAEALRERARLAQPRALEPATAWTWSQTLVHCAQSIEYSMAGFPEARSALFQRTVGAAAFHVFAWRGRMTHDLGEPIPGAAPLPPGQDVAAAVERLERAVQAFDAWQGPLKPHFAYGALDKAAYDQAHAMHLANHFSAFDQAA